MVGSSSLTWQVEYARFMRRPLPPPPPHGGARDSTHPMLTLSAKRRRPSVGDAWLKTSGTTAVLKLVAVGFDDDAVLRLSLHHRIIEEHFISMLHFSWPQMSCVSQTPVRGSRAVFASYKDSAGQIQNFVMRFLNASESQSFVNSLKEGLKYVTTVGTLSINNTSQVHSQNALTMHPSTDFEDPVHAAANQDPVVQYLSGNRVQHTSSEDNRLANDHLRVCPNIPSSSTALHADFRADAWQGDAELQKVSEELDLISPTPKYLNGSTFHALLTKLDRVIYDMGGDMALMP